MPLFKFNLTECSLSDIAENAVCFSYQLAVIDATDEELNTGLGVAYMRAVRTADAYRVFLLVRRLYPHNWKAPLGLALLHTYVDRSEDARRLLDEALELGGAPARKEASSSPVLAELLKSSPASD